MKPELFRPGTCDENVYRSVHELDEYKLNDLDLRGKTILDIGGHIGSFAYACIIRGAAKVISFEPDRENYGLLCEHLYDEIWNGKVEAYPLAVVGSDQPFVMFSGHTSKDGEINTGGGFVHGRGMEDVVLKEYQTGQLRRVPAVGIPIVLNEYLPEKPFLTKLDCEGGEWEILHGNVKEQFGLLCGEYHSYGGNTPEHLRKLLRSYNTVTIRPHGAKQESLLGLFWAK